MEQASKSASHSSPWSSPWLPTEHDVEHVCEVQLRYQRRALCLMCAAFVLYCTSAIQYLPDECQASFSFVPAARALSLAGILTQIIFAHSVPHHIPEALSFLTKEETRSRAIVFFASLWVPYAPFVLSIILLCCGSYRGACIPVQLVAHT